MAQLFIITANYGQYEDYCEVELFATVDEDEAYAKFTALQLAFAAVSDEIMDGMTHNGLSILAADPVATVVDAAWNDDGISLSLYEMVLGQLTVGKKRLENKYIAFVHSGDFVSFEESYEADSDYETMASPYEEKWLG